MLTNDRRADLFDGVEYFFNAIKAKCSSDEEYAAELLKARGFLLEDEGLILSDNSHPDDIVYLIALLIEEHLGEVKDGKIIIFPEVNVEKIFHSTNIRSSWSKAREILYKNNGIGSIAFPARKIPWQRSFNDDKGITWQLFIHNSYAPKVPLYLLEPFIGRYIKAISACGVQTHGSCDGNHLGRIRGGRILVEISSHPDNVWHEIIRQRLLVKNFNLNWKVGSGPAKILFGRENKWQTYTELNRAAEFLYNNRIKIRQIRREASDGISNAMTIRLPNDELAAIFSERANKLFDEFLNEV